MKQTITRRISCDALCMMMAAAPLALLRPPKYHFKIKYRQAALSTLNPSNQKNVSGCGRCLETNALSTNKYRQFKLVHQHR